MQRRLQKTGGKSLTMTLPKEWVKSFKLKEKDSVEICYQKDGKLVIDVPSRAVKPKIHYVRIADDIDEVDVEQQIFGLYIAGVSQINIECAKVTYLTKRWIRRIVGKLMGFDYLESSDNTIILKRVVGESRVDVVERVVRMVNITRSMFEDTALYINQGNRDLALDVIERDDEVVRLYLSILREFNRWITDMVNTQVDLSLAELHCYEMVSFKLEKMSDCIVRITRHFLTCKNGSVIKLTDKEVNMFSEISKKFNLLKEQLETLNIDKAGEYLAWFQAFEKEKIKNMTVPGSYFQLVLNEGFSRIVGYMANIAEDIRTINYAYGKH